ncbi:MAG: hypothetical protein WA830_23715 [Candidatus Sulfotelmatobacter sp.]
MRKLRPAVEQLTQFLDRLSIRFEIVDPTGESATDDSAGESAAKRSIFDFAWDAYLITTDDPCDGLRIANSLSGTKPDRCFIEAPDLNSVCSATRQMKWILRHDDQKYALLDRFFFIRRSQPWRKSFEDGICETNQILSSADVRI